MKTSLNKEVYCKNENGIYKISNIEIWSTEQEYGYINLELVAFYDYINTDYSNEQGWTTPDHAIEEIQDDYILWYMVEESIKECIVQNGYEIIEKLPKIQ